MDATALVVSICLLAQVEAPSAGRVVKSRLAEPAALVPVDPTSQAPSVDKADPAETLARQLVQVEAESVSGRPMTLLELLGPLVDRRQQIDVTLAYWDRWAALAQFQAEAAEVALTEQLLPPAANPPAAVAAELEAQLAAGHARLREAELDLVSAQYEVVERARRPTSELLPLPVDSPHVGPYRTHFQQIYGGRASPARAHLIDRSLPLRRKALNVRATAVQSARDAAEAAVESYASQTGALSVALGAISELGRQQSAFIHTARDYNHEIAEYALGIAPLSMRGNELVAMLIKTPLRPAGTVSATEPGGEEQSGGVEQAGFNAPLGPSFRGQEPTLAAPLSEYAPADANEDESNGNSDAQNDENSDGRGPNQLRLQPPTDEEPADDSGADPAGSGADESASSGVRRRRAAVSVSYRQAPAPREPAKLELGDPLAEDGASDSDEEVNDSAADRATQDAAESSPVESPKSGATDPPDRKLDESAAPPTRVDEEVEPAAHSTAPRKATKAGGNAPPPSTYQRLANLRPAERTQQLAALLHATRKGSPETGRQATLEECLTRARGTDRYTVIAAYWHAREALARWLIEARRSEQIKELASSALRARDVAGGPEAMLRLRTAELASQADVLDAELTLILREFALMQATGQPLDQAWLLPSTAPHAGSYLLKLEAQPEWVATSLPVQRLSQAIPTLHELLNERASAIVTADSARTEIARRYATQKATLDEVLAAIRRQAQETDAFLATQTEYNLRIADYALTVLPSGTADAKLLSALVIRPRG